MAIETVFLESFEGKYHNAENDPWGAIDGYNRCDNHEPPRFLLDRNKLKRR